MADTKRTRKLTASLTDDGKGSFAIYTRPDDTGKQGVAQTKILDPAMIHDSLRNTLILRGVADVLSIRVQRLVEPDASTIAATYDELVKELTEGTWTPGRSFEAAEPDDMAHALAEVTGQPVHVIVDTIQKELDKVKTDVSGHPMKDKAGRLVHVYSRAKLYKAFEQEPRVKQALAKILAEKARKLGAEARTAKPASTTGALDLFGTPQQANAAD